jgi:hypothetical protein
MKMIEVLINRRREADGTSDRARVIVLMIEVRNQCFREGKKGEIHE